MAQVEYTGAAMTLSVQGGTALQGLTAVSIDDKGRPAAEQLDATCYPDTTYVTQAHPLGGKGPQKATVVATMQASTVSFADNKATKVPFNTPATLAFAAGITSKDNTYTHTTMELIKRVTKITYGKPLATCELTFEANANGTWGNVA